MEPLTNTDDIDLNQYDKKEILDKYREVVLKGPLRRGFEREELEKQLPSLSGLDVIDLGCGFGTLVQSFLERGVKSIIGIDLSKTMIEESKKLNGSDPRASFHICSVEDYEYQPNSVDLVVSSFVLQLVQDYKKVAEKVYNALRPGGKFIFTVTHPIRTAGNETMSWHKDPNGQVKGWTVSDFHREDLRNVAFMVDTFYSFHRTTDTYVNTLIKLGFRLDYLGEPQPDMKNISDEYKFKFSHRPMLLLIAVTKMN
eukprot:gene5012-6241_t